LDGSEETADGYEEGWCVDLRRGRAYQVCKVWGGAMASSNLGRRHNVAKIHTARSEEMEEYIPIWYVFFRYYYYYYDVPELQCLRNSLSVIT
jgi:hypothetical protein